MGHQWEMLQSPIGQVQRQLHRVGQAPEQTCSLCRKHLQRVREILYLQPLGHIRKTRVQNCNKDSGTKWESECYKWQCLSNFQVHSNHLEVFSKMLILIK